MTTTTRRIPIAIVAGLLAVAAAPAAAADAGGFIHGTVLTRSGGEYTGVLRWGDEEAFWDDVFHSAKRGLEHLERYEDETADDGDRQERWWHLFGKRFRVSWEDDASGRIFAARFGDIAEIEVLGDAEAEVRMKTGSTYRVEGYANDVTATIHVADAALGAIEVPWRKIERIRFSAAPAGTPAPARRLAGTVVGDHGTFDGFVMWDSQECLSSDELDGDSEDGRMSIPMGRIAAIERHSRSSAKVTLVDGRELVLDGTNDVDSSIRGIFVEDPRFGRVELGWDGFRRLELRQASGSGRGYDAFDGGGPLEGRVTTVGGSTHSGRLVYDLDEAEAWEMLHGGVDGIEYAIPFAMVASVEPDRRGGAVVGLTSGEELRLEDGQDVTDRNDGVVVIRDDGETYASWKEIRRIELGR